MKLLVALLAVFALTACASIKREPKEPGPHTNHHHENHR